LTQFDALSLAPALLKALRDEGYATPTPIQAKAIPPALAGSDVLGIAQTGTGKTAAFALPTLHQLITHKVVGAARGPRALVLAPTRELAAQIGESFATYGRHTGLRHAVIFGGVGQGPQVQAIRRGADILVATPGRLIDLMEQKLVDLRAVQFLTLDEADRMLDMGFIQPIRRIARAVPAKRQTMLFSATMPDEIRHLVQELMHTPVEVKVTPTASTVDRIAQSIYWIGRGDKPALLAHMLRDPAVRRAVVFTKTKHGADKVVRKLVAAGLHAAAIHGNKAQSQRTRALDAFRSGRTPVLVATDIAARGLDVDGITHVFNFDLPMEPEAYVHRIGRTARAGASGEAISFCDPEERGLLKAIERLTKATIQRREVPAELPELPRVAHASTDEPRRASRGSHGGGQRRKGQGKRQRSSGERASSSSAGDHAGVAVAEPRHGSDGAPRPASPSRHGWPGYRGPSRRGRR
jgi:ATP-dependent RNA helicase RhlE